MVCSYIILIKWESLKLTEQWYSKSIQQNFLLIFRFQSYSMIYIAFALQTLWNITSVWNFVLTHLKSKENQIYSTSNQYLESQMFYNTSKTNNDFKHFSFLKTSKNSSLITIAYDTDYHQIKPA